MVYHLVSPFFSDLAPVSHNHTPSIIYSKKKKNINKIALILQENINIQVEPVLSEKAHAVLSCEINIFCFLRAVVSRETEGLIVGFRQK